LLAVLFLGSGLLTYQAFYWVATSGVEDWQIALQLLTGIPFGAVCSFRFVRPRSWFALTLGLDCAVWVAAYRVGVGLSGFNPYLGMALAGLLGGLGVTLSTGLGCRILYSRRTVAIAGLVGAVAGAPFGLVFGRSDQENIILAICFPLWQVVVGMWIWMNSERTA
jgi:hypothetical protein